MIAQIPASNPILIAMLTPIFSLTFSCSPQINFHGSSASAKSAHAHQAALKYPYLSILFESKHSPSMVGFHSFSKGRHVTYDIKALGSITRKSVTMTNQTKTRVRPVVRRSRVTPKDILEKVEAKQVSVVPMVRPTARMKRLMSGISRVCFPKPMDTAI